MSPDAIWNEVLGWLVRLAGLFWLLGAFMLFRQIRTEMALDRMAARIEKMTPDANPSRTAEDTYGDIDALVQRRVKSETEKANDRWLDRDDAARRGWIAGQAIVLAATAIAMVLLHPLASGLAALLVLGQGVYFIWRETTARRAPDADLADHARPTAATVNAAWVSLGIACLVWIAAIRGVLH